MSEESKTTVKKSKPRNINRRVAILMAVAFLAGAFWLFAIRFVLVEKQETHYHANFAVFVDGSRLPFDNFLYYEEVASCFGGEDARPQDRVHMHDNINHVVHVHRDAATWGHFFANLGMTLGDNIFAYDKVILLDDEQTKIRFILNGEEVDTIANRVIGDEDALLISIGEPSADDLDNQYNEIQKDAHEYNERQDPSACSGGKPFTFWERVKAALGFWND